MRVTTTSSSAIRSRVPKSATVSTISLRLASPWRLLISLISLLMRARRIFSSPRMFFNWFIKAANSLFSFSNFSRSSPVSRARRISKMACACFSEKVNAAMRFCLANSVVAEARMVEIMASIWSSACSNPAMIWSLASALSKSNLVRRLTTSFWCCR